ncbi:MAG TPA: hypothetical protein VGD66_04290 [Allosphingosinicella sp.]|jgi:hypothetical protein
MSRIGCIGWGSLVWRPKNLPVLGSGWRSDGPALSIEFARQSKFDRVTLVLCKNVPPVQTFWTELEAHTLDEAAEALRKREGTGKRRIGRWPGDASPPAATIGPWAEGHGLAGVVWTALPPKWNGKDDRFPDEDVLSYLRGLKRWGRSCAETYVRRAPASIRTPYRAAIEAELGWLPQESCP